LIIIAVSSGSKGGYPPPGPAQGGVGDPHFDRKKGRGVGDHLPPPISLRPGLFLHCLNYRFVWRCFLGKGGEGFADGLVMMREADASIYSNEREVPPHQAGIPRGGSCVG